MTKITPIYPPEFKRIEYTAYWRDFEKDFENSFGELKEVIVNINVTTLEEGEQKSFSFNCSNNIGNLNLYFVRYWRDGNLTPLSSPENFYTYIKTILNRVTEDFN
jgi:hypothetical protein